MVQKGIKMDIIKKIAEELQIRPDQVKAVVNLIDEGNTIPFIARYRKEAHGALNDEILRNLDERLTYLRNLEEKKSSVLASMEELGVLTDDLKKKMEQAQTLAVIEDLYPVTFRFVQSPQELTGVGRQAFHVASLSFCI